MRCCHFCWNAKEVKQLEDSQILDLFAARDERALAAAKTQYENGCFQIALRILRRREDAEEAINDLYDTAEKCDSFIVQCLTDNNGDYVEIGTYRKGIEENNSWIISRLNKQ